MCVCRIAVGNRASTKQDAIVHNLDTCIKVDLRYMQEIRNHLDESAVHKTQEDLVVRGSKVGLVIKVSMRFECVANYYALGPTHCQSICGLVLEESIWRS